MAEPVNLPAVRATRWAQLLRDGASAQRPRAKDFDARDFDADGAQLHAALQVDPRIGHKVVKTTGDYTFEGVVTAVIPKLKGGERFAVEDERGLILIMNAKQCGFEI